MEKTTESVKVLQNYPPNPISNNLLQFIKSKEDKKKEKKEIEIPENNLCVKCGLKGKTRVYKRFGETTCFMVLVCCCFFFPFCILPCYFEACKDTHHYCPYCNNLVAVKPP